MLDPGPLSCRRRRPCCEEALADRVAHYIVPRLLGEEPKELDIWHGSSDEVLSYLEYVPDDYFSIWGRKELEWASRLYRSPEFQVVLSRYVEIQRELKDEPPGPKRSRLVEEASALGR